MRERERTADDDRVGGRMRDADGEALRERDIYAKSALFRPLTRGITEQGRVFGTVAVVRGAMAGAHASPEVVWLFLQTPPLLKRACTREGWMPFPRLSPGSTTGWVSAAF